MTDTSDNVPATTDMPPEPPVDKPTQTPATKPATKQEPQTDDSGKDWETAYKGLQRSYETLQKRHTALQEKFDTLSEQHETLVQSSNKSTTSMTDLQKQLAERDATIQSLQQQGQGHEIYKQRMFLLMGEYSDLAPFEAQGLLPDAPTVELTKEKFSAFRESLKQIVGEEVLNKLRGAAPPQSGALPPANGNANTLTPDQLYAELADLGGRSDPESRARWEDLQKQWLKSFEPK